MTNLLQKISTINLPAVKKFEGKQFDTKRFYLFSSFGDKFLNKTEISVKKETYRISRLSQNSIDKTIIKELGGENAVEMPLAHVFEALKQLNKSSYYIFYCRDVQDILWAVPCYWFAALGVWFVEAYPIPRPRGWGAGRQVFSRDSFEPLTSSSKTLSPSAVFTDDHPSYKGLNRKGYKHHIVRHSEGEYSHGIANTNSAESFWALLKRGLYGTYHSVSTDHLQRYVNEFAFRSVKGQTLSFLDAVCVNARNNVLPYKELTNATNH
jgi:hypothetical protein